MGKRKLMKNAILSFWDAKKRFISIFLLSLLSAFMLVGLYVTKPNMRITAQHFYDKLNLADFTVSSPYSLKDNEKEALEEVPGLENIEYIYQTDVNSDNKTESFRIFSNPSTVSKFDFIEGREPKTNTEIALDASCADDYKIGDTFTIYKKDSSDNKVLNNDEFTIVGFVKSGEILTFINMGSSTTGAGSLTNYAVVSKDTFNNNAKSIAKLTFTDLNNLDPYESEYAKLLERHRADISGALKGQNKNSLIEVQEEYQKELNSKEDELKDCEEKYNNAKSDLTSAENKLSKAEKDISSAEKDISSLRNSIDTAKTDLSNAKNNYNSALNDYRVKVRYSPDDPTLVYEKQVLDQTLIEINAAELKIQQMEESYNNSNIKLDEARRKYDSSLSEYNKQKEKFEANENEYTADIESARNEIEEYRENILKMKLPNYSINTRKEQSHSLGYRGFGMVSDTIEMLSKILPIIFYLIVAFVVFVTIARFVKEDRLSAGILKAMGYSNFDITKKFIFCGAAPALMGTVFGTVLGHLLLNKIMYLVFGRIYTIPEYEYHFYPKITIIAVAISLICSVLPAFMASYRELSKPTYSLLRAKSGLSGSKILLEKIDFIWNNLKYKNKVIIRNAMRYKSRVFMILFGTIGAITLIFLGFASRDAVLQVNDYQFGTIFKYDSIIITNDNASVDEKNEFRDFLENDENIKNRVGVYYDSSRIKLDDNTAQTVSVIAFDNIENINDFVNLNNRKTNEKITLKSDGIVVSEKLASNLDVQKGDYIKIETSENKTINVRVSDVCEMYYGHYIFMSNDAYSKFYNEPFTKNAYLLSFVDSSTSTAEDKNLELMKMPAVSTIVSNINYEEGLIQIFRTLSSVTMILIVIALLLSITIIYNLININICEREQEITTLKVLGYQDKDAVLYIYKEISVLMLSGILIGELLNYKITPFILSLITTDELILVSNLTITPFIVSCITVLLILIISKYYISNHIKKIDIVNSLKINE